MPVALLPRQRAALKARAHALEPAVYVGRGGVQDSVVGELDRALTAHELLKVKIDAERDEREEISALLSARTDAVVVQRVGKIVVLWRPRPAAPEER
jgi:RNA-binding protein